MHEENSRGFPMSIPRDEDPLRYGFIYPVFRSLIELLSCLNLVNLFKAIGIRLARNESSMARNARIGIDIFLIAKWMALIALWLFGNSSIFAVCVVSYLLLMNIFTYFYLHIWLPPHDCSDENLRSRLVMLMFAILFNIACFGYLYSIPFSFAFHFDGDVSRSLTGLLFSVFRAFLLDFELVSATSLIGHVLIAVQTTVTFIFLSIILAVSVPQYSKSNQ
jgi:hypothetical protein